jgi:demethylmenaquinone methyltransferase/2-methoxy-6-polyprenyl-1,4-benzoquinol methylase
MNDEIRGEMLDYYNERAAEHDDVYRGLGPAIRDYSELYVQDVDEISRIATGFGSGHLIDIACGTGFWAPHYARNCTQITFIDQAEGMLSECIARVDRLELESPTHFVCGDFFLTQLEASTFNSALSGFLLSHLSVKETEVFFLKLEEVLKPRAELMVIDSLWNRRRSKHCEKEGVEERSLNDGRRFKVYKRYFEPSEFERMLESNGFRVKSIFAGGVLVSAVCVRAD